MEQPLITIGLCYNSTNLHEPYDPPTLLQIPLSKKSWGERAFAHAGPALWNSLPQELKDSNSLTSFKCNLKTHLFNCVFWREIFFLYGVHVYIRFSCYVCNLFCLCCKAPWAFNQNGYGAIEILCIIIIVSSSRLHLNETLQVSDPGLELLDLDVSRIQSRLWLAGQYLELLGCRRFHLVEGALRLAQLGHGILQDGSLGEKD